MGRHILELGTLTASQKGQFPQGLQWRSKQGEQLTKADVEWADIILGRPDPKLLKTREKPLFL